MTFRERLALGKACLFTYINVIVIEENDRIVKEYDDGRVEYIPEGSSGDG